MSRLDDLIQQLDFMKIHWGEPENQYLANEIIDETITELDKLTDYEDKQEQGLLVKLPVAEGTPVWRIHEHSGGGRVPNWFEKYECNFTLSMLHEWGITVFLTEAEADEALAQMKKD